MGRQALGLRSYSFTTAIHAILCKDVYKRQLYVVRGLAGADRGHARKFMVACERASQALFITQLLVRPTDEERAAYGEPDFTILAAPGYKCDPAIEGLNSEAAVLVNFSERTVVVAGTEYSGEIKKSVFSVMNYLLPVEEDVYKRQVPESLADRARITTSSPAAWARSMAWENA